MQWLRDPQRDSRDDIRASQQALVYAGFPHSDAVTEVTTHLHRVRAALANPRHALLAGFLTGAAMAIGVLLALTVALLGLGLTLRILVRNGGELNSLFWYLGAFYRDLHPSPSQNDPLRVLPVMVAAVPVLGLAGASLALVTRARWRRAGALTTLIGQTPQFRHLLESAAVWLGVAGLIVLGVRVLAGPEMTGVALMLTIFVVPLIAAAFNSLFTKIYAWMLLHLSPLDAAAYARPNIEREAARQIKSERDFYRTSAYDGTAYDRNRWADQELAAVRRHDAARGAAQRSGVGPLAPHNQRRVEESRRLQPQRAVRAAFRSSEHSVESERPVRTSRASLTSSAFGDHFSQRPWRWWHWLFACGVTIAIWRLTHWVAWQGQSVSDYMPDWPGAAADVIGLLLGLAIGVGTMWVYVRYVEDP